MMTKMMREKAMVQEKKRKSCETEAKLNIFSQLVRHFNGLQSLLSTLSQVITLIVNTIIIKIIIINIIIIIITISSSIIIICIIIIIAFPLIIFV